MYYSDIVLYYTEYIINYHRMHFYYNTSHSIAHYLHIIFKHNIISFHKIITFCSSLILFFPVVPALAKLPSLAWIVFFVLLVGLAIPAIRIEQNQTGTKCYYFVKWYYIVLEYNMQVMCNWMWCIIVEIYSMIVDYVLSIVDYDLTIIDYNFTLVGCIFILVENIISFSRIYTHFCRKYHLIL